MHSASCKRSALYKTEMCRSFEETGYCRYGTKCQFAHSQAELRQVSRHPRYKTEICKTFWELGQCPYGKRCCFIHGETKNQSSELFVSEEDQGNNREDDCKGKMQLQSPILLTPVNSCSFLRESTSAFALGATLKAPGSERRKSITDSSANGYSDQGKYHWESGKGKVLTCGSEDDFVRNLECKLSLLENEYLTLVTDDSVERRDFFSPLLALPVFSVHDFASEKVPNSQHSSLLSFSAAFCSLSALCTASFSTQCSKEAFQFVATR